MQAYRGATSEILVAGKLQPAIYGPFLGGFIFNPATIEEQNILNETGSIINTSSLLLGPFATLGFMHTGFEMEFPASIRATAMAGTFRVATYVDEVTFGPPENLYVTIVPPGGTQASGTTVAVLPGELWTAPSCFCGSIYVSAETAGHRFTSVVFQQPPNYPPTPTTGSFPPSGPVTRLDVLLAYLYKEWEDDDDLQGWVESYNTYAQLFIDWFNALDLPIYTKQQGALLDWVAQGIYGISRPTLFLNRPFARGPFSTASFCEIPFAELAIENDVSNVAVTSDDIFKRIITWHFYKGDGKNLTTTWLRRRVARFLFGVDGSDYSEPVYNISIEWSRTQLTITIVSAWSVCTNSGAFATNAFCGPVFCSLVGHLVPQIVPAAALQFVEGIANGSIESPVQYAVSARIAAKGVFAPF